MKVRWMAAWILAAAGVVAAAAPSRADTRIVFVRHDHRDTYRVGFDRGYRDGLTHGQRDGRRHGDYNFWHDGRYRRGDAGYRPWYGPRYEYISGYRRGYELGYRNAYAGTRHRHHGREGWCYERHDYAVPRYGEWDEDDEMRYEEPPRRRR